MQQDGIFLPGTSRAIEYGTLLGPSDPSQVPTGLPLPKTDEYALWLFHDNIPTTDKPILLPVGKSIAVGDGYTIRALAPVPWTGLTYRYDPGQGWVALGAAILVMGFVMSLFFVPVKLYARVSCEASGASVAVAATTTKGNAIYEDDFAGLMKGLDTELRRPVAGPADARHEDTVQAYA
jgi:cytochrome c biogenesis protein ResB